MVSLWYRKFLHRWVCHSLSVITLVLKIYVYSALYLGLRQMEWLFLTCHNYWIVCCLVRDDDHPFLAYLHKISIRNSSEPFWAFLGAILSILKGAHIEPSTFNPNIQLDTLIEETDKGPLHADDIDDHSGVYLGSPSKGGATGPMMTCYHAGHDNAEPELMVCPFVGSYLLCGWLIYSLPHPLTHLSPFKYEFISKPCQTTCSPFLCTIGMGNNACGWLAL